MGILLLFGTLLTALWQGTSLDYESNILNNDKDDNYRSFTYGLNGDVPTYSIDSSTYYNGNSGLAGWYDREYWNLTTDLPLNGRVFYPKDSGKYPLIVIVHGNHLAENPSQFGYDYLLKTFAQNGYIAVSIDENFLNGNWTTLGMGLPRENDARGYLILEHLKLLQELNNDSNSKLYKSIDMENIGLIGHSRGGEAISIAAAKGDEFNIKALMALSPTDRQYRENINLEDISYITIHGANDGDLITFKGKGQYNRTSFTGEQFNFKASYYVEGLNHVQFNSDWGEIDSAGLGKIFYGKNVNVKPEDQREISKVLGLTFFDITLKNKIELISFIKSPKTIKSLPSVEFITDYADSSYSLVNNFESQLINDNILLDKSKVNYIYRRFNRSLLINSDLNGSITLKKNKLDTIYSGVSLSIANNNYADLNLRITFLSDDVEIFKKDITVPGALEKNTFKTDIFNLKDREIESQFQFYEMNVKKWDYLKIETLSDNASYLLDNINDIDRVKQ